MKTAIIYSTTHGSTQKVSEYIKDKLQPQDVTLISLHNNKNPDITPYDRIILGGSIHLGEIQQEMIRFCKKNMDVLLTKTIGLFVLGITMDLTIQDNELEFAFPKELYHHAQATAFVGGEIEFEKLNASQKFITKHMLKYDHSVSFIHYDLIDIFLYQLEN